jgi:hypothetical protein
MRYLTILLLVTALVAAVAAPMTSKAGKYRVSMTLKPNPPTVGDNALTILVKDGDKPLSNGVVKVHLDMTTTPMDSTVVTTAGENPGETLATANFSMAGEWKITADVAAMADMKMKGDGKAVFTVDVKGAKGATPPAPDANGKPTPPVPAEMTSTVGDYTVLFGIDPLPPTVGDNVITLRITGGKQPLTAANIKLHLDMKTMSMPADYPVTPGANPNEYQAKVNFGMAGPWKVTVAIAQVPGKRTAGDGKMMMPVEVKQAAAAPKSAPPPAGTPTVTPRPAGATSPATPEQPAGIPWTGIILGAAVIAAVIVLIVVGTRKKK